MDPGRRSEAVCKWSGSGMATIRVSLCGEQGKGKDVFMIHLSALLDSDRRRN